MNPGELSTFYFRLITEFLGTPAGAFAVLLLMACTMLSVTVPWARWVFITGAVYAATLPINTVVVTTIYIPLAFPVEQLRLYSRPLTFACMTLLLLPLVITPAGWRRKVMIWPMVMFFVFEIGIGLRLTTVGGEGRGPLSLISYTLLFLTFGRAVGAWLQSFEDVLKLLWCVCIGGGLVVLTTVYQLTIDRTPIIYGNRLAGMTGNPQFLGIILALTVPTACYLIARPGGRKGAKTALVALVAVAVLLLIWTGSRTGTLGATIGTVVLFYRRLFRFTVIAAVVGLAIYLLAPYFEGSTNLASRLISSENTRAGVWGVMINDMTQNFWFGASRSGLLVNESSYLAMMGQLGLVGALPFIVALGGMAYKLLQLLRVRSRLGPDAILVDLICGFWGTIAAMAMFEGFLLGVLVFPVLLIYLFGGLTAYVLEWAEADAERPATTADPFYMPAAA